MNLYLLRRTNPNPGWDELLAVVVRAECRHDARDLVAESRQTGDEGAETWRDLVEHADDGQSYEVMCELLASGVPGEAGVVCVDFKAG